MTFYISTHPNEMRFQREHANTNKFQPSQMGVS